MNTPPTFPKLPYYEAFDLIAGLPPTVKANICSLLLRVWRHTNSVQSHENYGTAWLPHVRMAAELHIGRSTVAELFDDAWGLGFLSREHVFKKNGQRVVSTRPYTKNTCHGMGEYLGSRYWVNWDAVRQAQTTKPPVDGVPETGTPYLIGVPETTTPIENGVPETGTPVPETGTKGLIKVSIFTPSGASADDVSIAGEEVDRSRCALRASSEPSSATSAADVTDTGGSHVVVGGEPPFLPIAPLAGLCAPLAHPTSGGLARPTSGVPLPNASPAAGLKPPQEVNSIGSEDIESHCDAVIDAARRRQIERGTPVNEIFREAKSVFDKLRQEYKTKTEFEPKFFSRDEPHPEGLDFTNRKCVANPVWAAMPDGADIENDLKTNAEHRRLFAEMYRTLGRDVTLAKWEEFLINVDHKVTSREEGEIERTYLMEHFIQLNGVSAAGAA